MKRDMDLVRRVLRVYEELPAGQRFDVANVPTLEGASRDEVEEHLAVLIDGNLLNGNVVRSIDGSIAQILVFGLTWEGHEFLDASRDEKLWARAKSALGKAGAGGFRVIMSVLTTLATEAAKSQAGLG